MTDNNLHHAYVEAINSNDIDAVMALLADDIVFQAPGEKELIGADAVRAWGGGFFEAYDAKWDKREVGFETTGDHAISRYVYDATYTPRDGGEAMTEAGKGTCVYRRDAEGNWKLMIDSWSTDAA